MAVTSFGKILTVLDLFSLSRPVINVDTISHELGLSRPTSYRYLKELVSADLVQRMSGTSGDYTLGPKIAVLDYISRTTDPLVQVSIPYMKEMVERTELSCLLTFLNHDYCIDLHDESFKGTLLMSYGRGSPRPVYIGSSPKIIVAHLNKQGLHNFYAHHAAQLAEVGFAQDEANFLQKMKNIKKQGYYFSQGEVNPLYSGLSVPIKYSSKMPPMALTVVGSKNRFEFIHLEKLIQTMQQHAEEIERKYFNLAELVESSHPVSTENTSRHTD
ncbi:IclR family transcriptional regulator [Acinetobacter sp. MD2(2019)]|uniref:IclR family transcriptional regulator n=1 Tax=Acinetobacter sp. MD2(2019) TaxID=2605273 RepID=UPI002D1E5556|nr:IclR family transcriptional regulator C-terminal domain-containing protein [Acinetobacter sp. MD2(2019)]MEB3754325.1 helix-turn-helix domain-containing protein [Acinetobacter sp. MD2(2019)]